MRRYPITQEYKNISIKGSFNMNEKVNFLFSKMMDIEDLVRVDDAHNYSNLKQNDVVVAMSANQNLDEKQSQTKWDFEFNTTDILTKYLLAEIYTFNTNTIFRLLKSNDVKNMDMSNAVEEYIKFNVLNRYKLNTVFFWVAYVPIDNVNRGIPFFDISAKKTDDLKESIILKPYDNGDTILTFKQQQSIKQYTFKYYYDIEYIRL